MQLIFFKNYLTNKIKRANINTTNKMKGGFDYVH